MLRSAPFGNHLAHVTFMLGYSDTRKYIERRHATTNIPVQCVGSHTNCGSVVEYTCCSGVYCLSIAIALEEEPLPVPSLVLCDPRLPLYPSLVVDVATSAHGKTVAWNSPPTRDVLRLLDADVMELARFLVGLFCAGGGVLPVVCVPKGFTSRPIVCRCLDSTAGAVASVGLDVLVDAFTGLTTQERLLALDGLLPDGSFSLLESLVSSGCLLESTSLVSGEPAEDDMGFVLLHAVSVANLAPLFVLCTSLASCLLSEDDTFSCLVVTTVVRLKIVVLDASSALPSAPPVAVRSRNE